VLELSILEPPNGHSSVYLSNGNDVICDVNIIDFARVGSNLVILKKGSESKIIHPSLLSGSKGRNRRQILRHLIHHDKCFDLM
jgi:hypothetical protein